MLFYEKFFFDFFVIFRNWYFANDPERIMQSNVYVFDFIICFKTPHKS